jgi:two-component system sensor histidine kinase BaeS
VRRSLLLRLLLSLTVASSAVVATALLAIHATRSQPRTEVERSASLLETDDGIRAAQLAYASEHRSWDGVDALVRDLADRTGRRIALTTPAGGPIADSARPPGDGGPDLPAVPAALIDAAAPRMSTTLTRAQSVRTPTVETRAGERNWYLTAQEERERQAPGDAAMGCLRAAGIDATFRTGNGSQILMAAVPQAGEPARRLRTHPCVPAQLYAPSAAARELNPRTVEQTIACLDRHGLIHTLTTSSHGLQGQGDPAPDRMDGVRRSCRSQRQAALRRSTGRALPRRKRPVRPVLLGRVVAHHRDDCRCVAGRDRRDGVGRTAPRATDPRSHRGRRPHRERRPRRAGAGSRR